MRNYRNRERDKLPVVFVAPPEAVRHDPYTARLIWVIWMLRAQLDLTKRRLRIAHEKLGWSE